MHLDDFRAPSAKKGQVVNKTPTKAVPEAAGGKEAQSPEAPTRVLPEPDAVNRTKHRVTIRQTDEGIEEISKEEENGVPRERLSSEIVPNEPGKAASSVLKDGAEGGSEQPLRRPERESVTSSTSDWNAYAGKSTRFEVQSPHRRQSSTNQIQLSPEDRETLTAYFSTEVVDKIVALYNSILHSSIRRASEYGSVKSAVITDRPMRTKIHQDLRRIFNSRLESMTDNEGAMNICAMAEKPQWGSRQPNGKGAARQPQQNKRLEWKDRGGDYLHFRLYKENKDTMEAISWISKQLKMPPKAFQFAGTKDRRGVTVQRVSVYRVRAEQMIGAGRTLRQAKLGNYDYHPHELRLGDLIGNEFVITLRDCKFSSVNEGSIQEALTVASAVVGDSVNSFRENGFINYYGLQRFGTFSTRTDTVGVKMLQGDFKGAVDAILEVNPASLDEAEDSTYDKIASDDRNRAYAIQQFRETGISRQALESLPRKFSAESSIIRHLCGDRSGNDFQGALNAIPRNLRLMYVHAYQSLVWNVMAGLRWKEHGSKVVEGDLVLVREQADKVDNLTNPAEVDADGEVIIQPDQEDRAANADELFERARALTKEEAESGKYTIFDIVLPTPGFDILYPANRMAEHYKTFMASERGGDLDPHDMRRPWRDISLPGSYRKLLARPMGDVTFEVKAYSGDDEQFVETDLDKMMNEGKLADRSQTRHKPSAAADGEGETDPDTKVEDKIAVILKLQLGSSQYATMALRELMGPGGLQTYKPDHGGGR